MAIMELIITITTVHNNFNQNLFTEMGCFSDMFAKYNEMRGQPQKQKHLMKRGK
jgi:hypothetical protein